MGYISVCIIYIGSSFFRIIKEQAHPSLHPLPQHREHRKNIDRLAGTQHSYGQEDAYTHQPHPYLHEKAHKVNQDGEAPE